jgi:hypothetical protein
MRARLLFLGLAVAAFSVLPSFEASAVGFLPGELRGAGPWKVSRATWYGPGLYGRRTACGQVLTPGTRGVAHRRLPCGQRVEFEWKGRKVVAPVIDRGPYANGADWDLTGATCWQLTTSPRQPSCDTADIAWRLVSA